VRRRLRPAAAAPATHTPVALICAVLKTTSGPCSDDAGTPRPTTAVSPGQSQAAGPAAGPITSLDEHVIAAARPASGGSG